MGSSFSTKVKVGITTFIGLVALFGGTLWVKEFNPLAKSIRFTVVFNNGNGIASGDPVSVSGIKVGEVSEVYLTDDNKAAVEVFLTKKKDLSDDCTFTIEDVGLMGDKTLIIFPGKSDKLLADNSVYYGSESSGMNFLMSSAGDVLAKLNSISGKIDRDLDLGRLIGSFEQTVEKLSQTLDIYKAMADDNREPLRKSISNFEETSREMRAFVQTNDTRLDKAIVSFNETTDKISEALDNFNRLSAIIDTVTTYMDAGEGTFARLIKSDELYEEIRRTNANIDSFVVDFKRNPGKYTNDMNFKIRLF